MKQLSLFPEVDEVEPVAKEKRKRPRRRMTEQFLDAALLELAERVIGHEINVARKRAEVEQAIKRYAASVSEALAAIRSHPFDVLLSDINIDRESDGFTVVEAMRQANPDCVTILLTGYPAFETAVRSIRAEADDYFTKPADLNAIVSAIDRKLLARGIQRTLPTKKASQTTG